MCVYLCTSNCASICTFVPVTAPALVPPCVRRLATGGLYSKWALNLLAFLNLLALLCPQASDRRAGLEDHHMGRRGGRSIYLLYWYKSANAGAVTGTTVPNADAKGAAAGGADKEDRI